MNPKRAALALLAFAAFASPAAELRLLGYNDMREMLEPVARRFEATHPGVRVRLELPGTRFAPAALARGDSDLAPMGAVFTPAQLAEYRAIVGADPVAIRVAHASLDPRALSGPLALFVHDDNPIASLTLEDAGRIFSGEVSTWGELGVRGEWASHEIVRYGLVPNAALAHEFKAATMQGRGYAASVKGFAQSAEVVDAVARERDAIGFAAAMRARPQTRVVPIAAREGEAAVLPTQEVIAEGRYPLDRYLLIYVRPPLTPLAADFLRLVLSREGQDAVAATSQRYIPLSAREVDSELGRLSASESRGP